MSNHEDFLEPDPSLTSAVSRSSAGSTGSTSSSKNNDSVGGIRTSSNNSAFNVTESGLSPSALHSPSTSAPTLERSISRSSHPNAHSAHSARKGLNAEQLHTPNRIVHSIRLCRLSEQAEAGAGPEATKSAGKSSEMLSFNPHTSRLCLVAVYDTTDLAVYSATELAYGRVSSFTKVPQTLISRKRKQVLLFIFSLVLSHLLTVSLKLLENAHYILLFVLA